MRSISVSQQHIDGLRKIFDLEIPHADDFQWQINPHYLETIAGITGVERMMQTARKRIMPGCPAAQLVDECLAPFGIRGVRHSFMNFSRAFLPIAIHVDIPEHSPQEDGWTIMIPLTFDDRIKTVAFEGTVKAPIFDYWIEQQDWRGLPRANRLRDQFNMDSAYHVDPTVVDHMGVSGMGDWIKGNAFCFRRSQPHCSTNFRSLGISHKDYVLVQTRDSK